MNYSSSFFKGHESNSYVSAKKILPILLELFDINSILDVGCGNGTWLKAASELGINTFMGVDGKYVKKDDLVISKENFIPHDLGIELQLNKKFDAVITMEVAEHIYKKNADNFINTLINHSELILFSAAIPLQLGTHHVNEQLPIYWIGKFKQKGYLCLDIIRGRVLSDKEICSRYRQNALIFISERLYNQLSFKYNIYDGEYTIVFNDTLKNHTNVFSYLFTYFRVRFENLAISIINLLRLKKFILFFIKKNDEYKKNGK